MHKKILAIVGLSLAVLGAGSGVASARVHSGFLGKADVGSEKCFPIQFNGAVTNVCDYGVPQATRRYYLPTTIDANDWYWWRVRATGVSSFMCEARGVDDGGSVVISSGLRDTNVNHGDLGIVPWGTGFVVCNVPTYGTIVKFDYWK